MQLFYRRGISTDLTSIVTFLLNLVLCEFGQINLYTEMERDGIMESSILKGAIVMNATERTSRLPRRAIIPKRTATEKSKKSRLLNQILRDKWLYAFLLPVVVYFLIFKYVPIFLGVNMAFRDFNLSAGIFGSKWVGIEHFKSLFQSKDFYNVLKNTIFLNVYLLIFSFPFPIILSILLNEIKCKAYKRVAQSVLYVPHFISWVVLGGIVITLLSPSTGVINGALKMLGFEPIYFLASEGWWPVVFVVSEMWQSVGWGTIIYMAAITGISPDLYEAAIIDGASKWKQMLHITLPGISTTVVIMLIMRMGKMLEMNFEQIYALQNDAVRNVSEVISTYEYRIGLQGARYSYTTALGLFKGVVGIIFITLTNKLANHIGDVGLW